MDNLQREHETLARIVNGLAVSEKWHKPRLPCDYLVIDTETTSLSSDEGRVVQVGMCAVRNCEPTKELWDSKYTSFIIKWPKEHFVGKEKAIAVHKIDAERSQKEGIDPQFAMEIVRDMIRWARDNGMAIVGHNIYRFDKPYLEKEMARNNVPNFQLDINELFDTGVLVKAMQMGMVPVPGERFSQYMGRVLDRHAKGVFYNLSNFCYKRFNLQELDPSLNIEEAHDAGCDCWLVHLLIMRINQMLEAMDTK